MWNFKGTLWNSAQNILHIHWKIWFLYIIEILRALRFKSSYAFLKCPPDAWCCVLFMVWKYTFREHSGLWHCEALHLKRRSILCFILPYTLGAAHLICISLSLYSMSSGYCIDRWKLEWIVMKVFSTSVISQWACERDVTTVHWVFF